MLIHKKVVVTGGAGFIGSSVVKELIKLGYDVTVIDDLSSGNLGNLNGLKVNLIQKSIEFIDEYDEIFQNVDIVFHLAASVGRQKSIDNPLHDANINYIGTLKLLNSMVKHGVKKIIYSSSAAIYGELQTSLIAESHPLNPDSPYGVSKLAAEKVILAYADIYNFSAICLRYFNIYGINQRFDKYGNVIPIFAKKLINNEPLTVFGDGMQTRDFINVVDVAKANILAATIDAPSGFYNIGSGSSITINYLISIMMPNFSSTSEVTFLEKRKGDVLHCTADTSKARKVLGFIPTVTLVEGIKEYIEWFKKDYWVRQDD